MSANPTPQNSPSKQALTHVLKVAAFIIGSAVVPVGAALLYSQPWFLAAAPAFNLLASFLVKYSGIKADQASGS